jgi:RNA polymerase sigma-70 factor (ECF subfamily)
MNNKQESLIHTGDDLFRIIEQKDRNAFTTFYSTYFKKLILVADRYVEDIQIAEGIVQDVFLKIWEDKELLPKIQSIKAFLYRSVVNSSINYVNRQRNIERHHQKIVEELSAEDAEQMDDYNELIVILHREIDLLPVKCQQVFKLSRLEGKKYRDVASELGISEKTVENHMGNALKILRFRLLEQSQFNPVLKNRYLKVVSLFLF